MLNFTMRHEIDCTAERYWELFFDDALEKEIYAALGSKFEVLEIRETDEEVFRLVKAWPKLDVPPSITKLVGDAFSYTEEGRFDRAAKVYRFKVVPSTLADTVRNEGALRIEPRTDGKCTRVVDMTAEARIFGVGGVIEKLLEKTHREGWAKSAVLFSNAAKR